jgi:hypothetical protein
MSLSGIEVTVSLELVESLINYDYKISGSVVVHEIKTAMEKYIAQGLMRGCNVTLKDAFEACWVELVLVEPTSLEMSMEKDYF